jgi:hypothetical protein
MHIDLEKVMEDRMVHAIGRALRPLLLPIDDPSIRPENDRLMDAVSRAAWREFMKQCKIAEGL